MDWMQKISAVVLEAILVRVTSLHSQESCVRSSHSHYLQEQNEGNTGMISCSQMFLHHVTTRWSVLLLSKSYSLILIPAYNICITWSETCGGQWCSFSPVPLGLSVHSLLAVPLSPSERLGTNIGGDEVAVAHATWPAEEVCQTMGDACGCVARPLLCCNAEREKIALNTESVLPRYAVFE